MLSRFTRPLSTSPAPRACLRVEALESRLVPYSVSGSAWVHPELVSISFMPDGINLGSYTTNLYSAFNARFGSTAAWQNEFLRAAQVWAQQTNLNFTVVSDDGRGPGSGAYQQGDPGVGDVRIGGYNGGGGTAFLGYAHLPPQANNFGIAGDTMMNTGHAWVLGPTGGYNLMTVAMHEIGHALGLLHYSPGNPVMYPTYTGNKDTLTQNLRADDISGIRNIYSSNSARSQDSYDAAASNGTFATATDITATIDPTALTALVIDRDLTTASDLDYYVFTAPSGTTGTLSVTVQSSGLSLLSPKFTVYAADQTTVLGSATAFGDYNGATLTATVTGVTAGQVFYVRVSGAETRTNPVSWQAFNTGKYAVTLNFGNGASPTVPLPNTQTANGDPLQYGGSVNEAPQDHDHDHGGDCTCGTGRGAGPAAAHDFGEPAPEAGHDAREIPALAGRAAAAAAVVTTDLRADRALIVQAGAAVTTGVVTFAASPAVRPSGQVSPPAVAAGIVRTAERAAPEGGAGDERATATTTAAPAGPAANDEDVLPATESAAEDEVTEGAWAAPQACRAADACFAGWGRVETEAERLTAGAAGDGRDDSSAVAAGLAAALAGMWAAPARRTRAGRLPVPAR